MSDILESQKLKELKEKKRLLALRVRRNNEKNDLKEVLSTPAGRRVWRRLLEECGCFRSPHVVGDAYFTHIKIGEGNIGRWAMGEMDESRPTTYLEMTREFRSDLVKQQAIEQEIDQTKEE